MAEDQTPDSPEVATPDVWCTRLGITVHGPDGWRRDGKAWTDPVTEDDFMARVMWSSCEMPVDEGVPAGSAAAAGAPVSPVQAAVHAGSRVSGITDDGRQVEIMAGYLVVPVDGCTCDGGGEFPHRPECGYEPAVPLAEVEAALARAGRSVVRPPAPVEVDSENVGYWGDERTPEYVSSRPPNDDPTDSLHGVHVDGLLRHSALSPNRAREVAAWLIAAADHAERAAGSQVGCPAPALTPQRNDTHPTPRHEGRTAMTQYTHQPAPHYQPAPHTRPKPGGLAISSLVLGIVGIVLAFMPILNNLTAAGAFVGLILGAIGIWRSKPIMSSIAVVLCCAAIALTVAAQVKLKDDLDEIGDRLDSVGQTTGAVTPAVDPAPAPTAAPTPKAGYAPAPGDFALEVVVVEEKCFGSAGCNVTFTVDVSYLRTRLPDSARTFTAIYDVTGGDEPLTDRFTVTGTRLSLPAEQMIQTSGPNAVLTAAVTRTM